MVTLVTFSLRRHLQGGDVNLDTLHTEDKPAVL